MPVQQPQPPTRVEECSRAALQSGLVSGGKALLVSGSAVAAAYSFLPSFRKATGVSSRTALIASPLFFVFFLQTELTMSACAQRKREFAVVTAP
jgi:hypothetical protein